MKIKWYKYNENEYIGALGTEIRIRLERINLVWYWSCRGANHAGFYKAVLLDTSCDPKKRPQIKKVKRFVTYHLKEFYQALSGEAFLEIS